MRQAAPEPRARHSAVTALTAFLALAIAACSSAATPGPSAAPTAGAAPASAAAIATKTAAPSTTPVSLTIYGAASLTAVLDKVKTVWQAANPGSTLTISTDSSSALETKIEQGAPADIFLSADTTNPQKLIDNGFGAGSVTSFATNSLTIIVPTANTAGIKTPEDLAKAGIKIITCDDTVPIGRYAAQLVANLARQASFPTDYVAKYAANIVSKEANVSAVVSKIELGEGDAGIVYVTDAKASTKVRTIAVPDGANVPAIYGGVVVKASTNVAAARAFLTWLTGADGQAVLASFGFQPPT